MLVENHPHWTELMALMDQVPRKNHILEARMKRFLAIQLEHGSLLGRLPLKDAQWFGVSRRHIRSGAFSEEFTRFFRRLEEVLQVRGRAEAELLLKGSTMQRRGIKAADVNKLAGKMLKAILKTIMDLPDDLRLELEALRPDDLHVKPGDKPLDIVEAIWWHYFSQVQALPDEVRRDVFNLPNAYVRLVPFMAVQKKLLDAGALTARQLEFWEAVMQENVKPGQPGWITPLRGKRILRRKV